MVGPSLRLGASCLALAAWLPAVAWGAEVRVEGGVDAAAVRQAVHRELGELEGAQLDVAVGEREVRVRFAGEGREPIERSIPRPARDEQLVDAVAWLAGNLARDQTSALLAALTPPSPEPAPPDPWTRAAARWQTGPRLLPPAPAFDPTPPMGATVDTVVPEDDDAWRFRPRAIAYASTASLVNAGALVSYGPLDGQLTFAAHPISAAWLGGQLGVGATYRWDGPFLGIMGSYTFFKAANDEREEQTADGSLRQFVLHVDDSHQLGLQLRGGWELNAWVGLFVGAGLRVDVTNHVTDRLLPDIAAGVLLF